MVRSDVLGLIGGVGSDTRGGMSALARCFHNVICED